METEKTCLVSAVTSSDKQHTILNWKIENLQQLVDIAIEKGRKSKDSSAGFITPQTVTKLPFNIVWYR